MLGGRCASGGGIPGGVAGRGKGGAAVEEDGILNCLVRRIVACTSRLQYWWMQRSFRGSFSGYRCVGRSVDILTLCYTSSQAVDGERRWMLNGERLLDDDKLVVCLSISVASGCT